MNLNIKSIIYILSIIIAMLSSSTAANAEHAPVDKIEITDPPAATIVSDDTNKYLPKVTLVLGGGGCKALTQIGVLRVLAKNQIPIHYVVGTSAGAIIGSLYAANVPLEDIEKMVYDGSLQRTMTPHLTLHILGLPLSTLAHLGRPRPYAGVINGSRLERFLRKRLPADFSQLKIPFAAVATDIETGNTCMITSGDLRKAVVASSAVPLLVRPVAIHNSIFIDGGLKANLPTNCAQLTGADIIIAVPADAPVAHENKQKFRSMKALAYRVTDIMEAEIDKHRWEEADLVVNPKVADTPAMTRDPEIIRRTIKYGEEAATKALPRIRELLNSKFSQTTSH